MNKILIMIALLCVLLAATVAADPDFEIDIRQNSIYVDQQEKQGDIVQIIPKVTNTGTSGTMKVECGVYTKEQVQNWGFSTNQLFSLFVSTPKVQNCVSDESNVYTREVTLDAGETVGPGFVGFTFKPIAPYSDPNDDYVILCVAFERCYEPGVDSGMTSFDVVNFNLLSNDEFPTKERCDDGILNQGESDTDCGGPCNGCGVSYVCEGNSDCSTGVCDFDSKRCFLPGSECGDDLCSPGEEIACSADCKNTGTGGATDDDGLNPVTVKLIGIMLFALLGVIAIALFFASKGSNMVLAGFAAVFGLAFVTGLFVLIFQVMGGVSFGLILGGLAFIGVGAGLKSKGLPFTEYLVIVGVIALLVGLALGAGIIAKAYNAAAEAAADAAKETFWKRVFGGA